MLSAILVNIVADNGLLPDGTNTLPETILSSIERHPPDDNLAVNAAGDILQNNIKLLHLKLQTRVPRGDL